MKNAAIHNMFVKSYRILSYAVVTAISTLAVACVSADPITLTVRAIDHNNSPMANVPMEFGVCETGGSAEGRPKFQFGFTDAAGELTGSFEVTAASRTASARLWGGRGHNLSPAQRVLAADRQRVLLDTTSSLRLAEENVPAGATTHTLIVQFHESVAISMKFTNTGVQDWSITLGTRSSIAYITTTFGQTSTLKGIQKGVATTICASTETPEVYIRALTAAETAGDVNLGDIQLPEPQCTAAVSLTMTNHTTLWSSHVHELRNMVTYIKKDDARVFDSFVNRTTNKTVEKNIRSDDVFKLPPGEYYVIPGAFGSDIHWKVYDLVKGNHQALLDAAQIPKITAVDGQTAEGTIDAKKVRDDIRAIIMP